MKNINNLFNWKRNLTRLVISLILIIIPLFSYSQIGRKCRCLKLQEIVSLKDSVTLFKFSEKKKELIYFIYIDKNQLYKSSFDKGLNRLKIKTNKRYFICMTGLNKLPHENDDGIRIQRLPGPAVIIDDKAKRVIGLAFKSNDIRGMKILKRHRGDTSEAQSTNMSVEDKRKE